MSNSNINGLTNLAIPDNDDELIVYDSSESSTKKTPVLGIKPAISTMFPSGTTTTLDTLQDTGLGFAIGANEVWQFEMIIQHGCNGAGGLKFEVQVPTGADHRSFIQSLTSGGTAFTSQILTTGNETAININTVASAGQGSEIKGIVVNGSTAGNVRLRFRSITAGQTSSVFKETYCIARRLS